MSTVRAIQTTFLGTAKGQVTLHAGEEYDSEDPLVKAHPGLFTQPKPEPRSVRKARNG